MKNIIFKYFTHKNTTIWYNKLNDFINTYNNSPHSGICNFSPNEAEQFIENIRECHLAKLNYNVKKLKIGDYVRVKMSKKLFDKGYLKTYIKEIYKIVQISENSYFLNRINNLQKVNNKKIKEQLPNKVKKETKHGKFIKFQKKE